jgi:anti-anti-sigma factor
VAVAGPASHLPASDDTAGAWKSSSIVVSRADRSVLVKVLGALDQITAAGLRHILSDLADGQTNVFVRVEYDVLAEASVFAAVSTLEPPSAGTALEAGGGLEFPPPDESDGDDVDDGFKAEVVDCWGAVHVDLAGELDLSEIETLSTAIDQLVADHPTPCSVALDLAGVTFIDLQGVRALAAACAHLLSKGFRVSLRSVGPMVERVAEMADVHFRADAG